MTASTGSAPAVPPVTPALRAQAARQRTTRLLHLSGHHLEAGTRHRRSTPSARD
ncbi:hypothetical protein M2161_004742 [Streptomyces sp. SAI-133]|uniref:hypothetical protein n=1 Tax=unclassified Streptomyces TaxID=2593676 RepID=UPI002475CE96|nr:hypothetical protein [Streptomyces sp. SAI-133]MDH6585636.1 hypothetical protein [Streptomyces sp. SAI-133]